MSTESSPTPAATSQRSPTAARLLSFLAPGLGVVYAGHLLAGLVINLLVVLLVLLFILAATLVQFFPLLPAIVLGLSWVVICSLSGSHAVELIHRDQTRDGNAYQHPLIYALIALLTFFAPLAMTVDFTARHLWTVVTIDDTAMYPQTQPGDRVLVDRTGYQNKTPRRGDPVVIRHPHTDELAVFRVVAIPHDVLEIFGYTLTVNGETIDYLPLSQDSQPSAPNLIDEFSPELWIEENHGRRYPITILPGASVAIGPVEAQLDEDQYFVLADNRSLPEDAQATSHRIDSRIFGAISGDQIEGRPIYVAWSTYPQSGSPDWDRIGLPTR